MKEEKVYCSKCGLKMESFKVRADLILVEDWFCGDMTTFKYGIAYKTDTGEPNMIQMRRCPEWRNRWFGDNGHDYFLVEGKKHLHNVTVKL